MTDRTDDTGDENADEEEWQFTLEDIEQREAEAESIAEAEQKRTEPVEAGSPTLENTVFVLLGVVFALFVLSRLVM